MDRDWLKHILAQQADGLLRHFLGAIGGVLIERGVMTTSQETQIIGGVLALIAVLMSIRQKQQSAAATKGAITAAYTQAAGVTLPSVDEVVSMAKAALLADGGLVAAGAPVVTPAPTPAPVIAVDPAPASDFAVTGQAAAQVQSLTVDPDSAAQAASQGTS